MIPPSSMAAATTGLSLLAQLQQQTMTKIWLDTAQLDAVKNQQTIAGVTTNPSLVWQAAKTPRHFSLFEAAASTVLERESKKRPRDAKPGSDLPPVCEMAEQLAVDFGAEALRRAPPGSRVCTQLDVRLGDTNLLVSKALELMELYAAAGVAEPQERVLVKTPATWEGLRATEELERRGVRCLVTLVCSEAQGRAAAEAGATMLAVYVGRVADWHRASRGGDVADYAPEDDSGVALAAAICDGIKSGGAATEVMAASFRSAAQAAALAGRCHHLTVSPALLGELAAAPALESGFPLQLPPPPPSPPLAGARRGEQEGQVASSERRWGGEPWDEQAFSWALFRDKCGTQVTSRSVTGFLEDTRSLEMSFYKLAASKNGAQQP